MTPIKMQEKAIQIYVRVYNEARRFLRSGKKNWK
jgi:hypothetical protein